MSEEAVEVRRHIIDSLRRELVGPDAGHPLVQWGGPGSPFNGDEILRPQDSPRTRYGAGILFPSGMTYSGLIDDGSDLPPRDDNEKDGPESPEPTQGGAESDDAEGEADEDVPILNSFVPSSMGLSFLADTSDGLKIVLNWATYIPQDVAGWYQGAWFRRKADAEILLEARTDEKTRQWSENVADGLALAIVDRLGGDGLRLLTVTLINRRTALKFGDEDCFYQCQITVTATGTSSICPYPSRPDHDLDPEERSLKLLYRHRPIYAVGHGCAADWTVTGNVVTEVRSESLPQFTQHPILPRDRLEGVNLSMLGLSQADDESLSASCNALIDRYSDWISARRADAAGAGLSPELQATAAVNLDRCEEALQRMRNGVRVLTEDTDAMLAFRWMNFAMVQQRSHYGLSADKNKRRAWVSTPEGQAPERPFVNPEYPGSVAWRPFQLAFILMNLRSMTDNSPEGLDERDLVDVIWFPTGGGKTEAYLGLAAWVMLYRRLSDRKNGGTSVLMRYTLRLLTAQQFQRASSLICAIELLRRRQPRLGDEPFTIGLWLGSGVTPNTDEKAVEMLASLDGDDGPNPFVVLSCPWCGVEMGRRQVGKTYRVVGYERVRDPRATVRFRCQDPNCDFHQGLPLEVVDSRIYRRPPTMVIGTVDKFAMLAWTPEARRLFGIDVDGAGPPDLIIQDELHLISGPLGSMVGHYETLIDELCTRQAGGRRLRPKIVASTATIARADEQVRALYARPARLFPPQALQAGESFFAEERSDIIGRTYVGVLAAGLSSHVVAQIRTIAVLMQAPATLKKGAAADAALDPYWSLITYFNSLRELGRASTLIQADIREYLNWIWQRTGVSDMRTPELDLRRFINNPVELTSRVPSSDIPEILERLFTAWPDQTAVDVCFATNMIQVGLDVPRLSLMMIVGQPKGASEYIQASSRVGRDIDKPGLVVTNYNPFKPRDRSHFETFRQFHEGIYRHVEPTSVTPFSLPVSERAIHALAIAYMRCTDPAMRERPGSGPSSDLRERTRDMIMRRVAAVAPEEVERAESVLNRFFSEWENMVPERYGDFSPVQPESRPLMIPAGRIWRDGEDRIPRQTPSSMRSVDAESEARVLNVSMTQEEA